MNAQKRKKLRAAALIRDLLVQSGAQVPGTDGVDSAWQECRKLAARIATANQRGWHSAARRLGEQFPDEVNFCRRRLDELCGRLNSLSHPAGVPTERELCEEILALEDEFDEVAIDLRGQKLSVMTDAVVLEGVNLGRFEIVLSWRSRHAWEAYRVVALDPNAPASNPETTHPHVQNDELCEGEGRTAIRRALNEGRLVDFFILVRQVLQTYNDGSAYVRLDDWNAIRCRDCGEFVQEDYQSACDRCGADCCSACTDACGGCGSWCCSECLGTCSGCSEKFCAVCLKRCDGCGAASCRNCLKACPQCAKLFCATCMSACEECNQSYCPECLDYDQCPKCRKANEEENQRAEEAALAMA